MKKSIQLMAFAMLCTTVNAQLKDAEKLQLKKSPLADISAIRPKLNNSKLNGTITQASNAPFDFSNVKMCIDKPSSGNALPARNLSSISALPKINANGDISRTSFTRQGLASETDKMWDPGQKIKVFLSPNNSTDFIRNKVQFYARKWEDIANIKFEFVTDINTANVKVGFENTNKSWSWLGKDVLFNPFGQNTMNFGWFSNTTAENEFSRTVLHEFGHALGFVHEHQSPAANIPWDKEKVYAFFAAPPDAWSRGDVDNNVFNKYSSSNTNFSTYDRNSIMHYSFPKELTTDGSSFTSNTDFSATDKQYAAAIYPFPQIPSNATGTLRTGDDCDLIDFTVEYNAAPSDKVEFVLNLGQNNNKKVTWWKQIVVPTKNNTGSALWVQNHSLIQSENKANASIQLSVPDLDLNKGISFWKAKVLGVHTLLNYKWNVLPALKGGCRVTLVWKNDTCL